MTLADDDTNSILADDANRAIWVDGCHLDGGRAQCGLGDHQGGRQKFLADMDLDMVVDKEVDKLVDMVAGHGCWLIGPKLVGPNLDTRLTHLLSFGSLFGS